MAGGKFKKFLRKIAPLAVGLIPGIGPIAGGLLKAGIGTLTAGMNARDTARAQQKAAAGGASAYDQGIAAIPQGQQGPQPIEFSAVNNVGYNPNTNLASANLYGAGSTPTTRSVSSGVDGLPSARAAQPFEMFGPGPDEEYAYGGPVYLARGGIAGLQQHEYAAGGRFLNGPGDGTSDSIRANIEGEQEARLADGEFVIPADVVSHIGNGSSKAGAEKLYAMMDKIRHARTGTTKMGKTIEADKYLPA